MNLAFRSPIRDPNDMKTMSLEDARQDFDTVFKTAAKGELVVISQNNLRVAVHAIEDCGTQEFDVAPPGYFAADYSAEDVAEINLFAAHGPQTPLP
jgi:hypothetical protein